MEELRIFGVYIFELIGGAENFENVQNKDTIRKNLLSFLKEIISLKKCTHRWRRLLSKL